MSDSNGIHRIVIHITISAKLFTAFVVVVTSFYLWCFSAPPKVDLFKLIQVSWRSTNDATCHQGYGLKCVISVCFSIVTLQVFTVDSSSRRRNSERQVKGWLPFHINFISIVLHSTVIPKHSPPTTDTVSSVSTPTREYPIGCCIVYSVESFFLYFRSNPAPTPPEKQMTVGDCFLNSQNNWITRSCAELVEPMSILMASHFFPHD